MHRFLRPTTVVVAVFALSACASLPRERGYAETSELLATRIGVAPATDAGDPSVSRSEPPIPTEAIDADQAIRLAFLYNPRIRQEYARLGLGRAELEQARRIANPGFGYTVIRSGRGEGSQITRSLSLSFTELLLLPARQRFAAGDLARLENVVAAQLLDLATEVELAWYTAVGAGQINAMRELVAQSAQRSAELAQRFFDAGNINRLELDMEFAAAAHARIAAVRAKADALRARGELAKLIGLPVNAEWHITGQLAGPTESVASTDELVQLALTQRLDLAAAQQKVALREDALGVTRRWRWLGAVELGFEREHELDGDVLRGPSLALELPIFNQGQAAITRAKAELLDARARLDALVFAVHSDVRVGLEHLSITREIAERYRMALLPRRESIVARTQEEVNFMLRGVFELILVKQQEYDAYQEYLEAVRDYWSARAELRRTVGGRLPDDDAVATKPTIGVESILPPKSAPAMDHSKMDHSKMDMPAAADPTPATDAQPSEQHHHGETP